VSTKVKGATGFTRWDFTYTPCLWPPLPKASLASDLPCLRPPLLLSGPKPTLAVA